ncbi:ATPase [Listeria monocytogenes]|uniref:AAA family ATPase n=1 Tax=Listeria monocytogenes TaxID=1639 RepID=UPI0008699F24|nr:ATPase [Listeria monocytogenes]EAG6272511.1 ATPase [Listeria monocytogenes CFSAN003726]EAG6360634.1 ATPase [Listeria monocytogenes CFSAN003729]EAG6369638.1 ATPase [Listeria monocytogenes CFSAN003728]EAC3320308.1 ATPase [Listeria monocytogenes]EAC4721697.1 ATPase [Listeria monocytogenes]
MNVQFEKLEINNFKDHKQLTVYFDDRTEISGKNGAGKTSIGEAITWLLYGTDLLGNKIEPQPIGTEEEVTVSLLFKADGKEIFLTKKQKKTAKYSINAVPRKATEFTDMVDSLFDKSLFYSLYSPAYFFSQHWQTQREQLLSYLSEPGEKEVLETLSTVDQDTLTTELSSHLLEDLDAINRETFRTSDNRYERASERVLTLKEQLANTDESNADVEALTSQKAELIAQRTAMEKQEDKNYQLRNKYSLAAQEIDSLKAAILRKREEALTVREQEIDSNCTACGQPLQGEAIEFAENHRKQHYNDLVKQGKKMVEQLEDLKAKLSKLEQPQQKFDQNKYTELDERIIEISGQIQLAKRASILSDEINDAEKEKQDIRKKRNNAQTIVEAIKRFKAKKSELMVEKVNDLFENITIKLYETLKNGTEKPTFEVEWNNRPYSKLSTAEKIIAGIEFANALSDKAETVVPCFVDNAESVIDLPNPKGQLITASVKKTKLSIKGVSAK